MVDDNPFDRDLIRRAMLRSHPDVSVATTCDGEEAWQYLTRSGKYAERTTGHPKLVLADLKMPKVNGLELLQRLRSHPALAEMPVVMFTSSNQHADIAIAYHEGVNAYVIKPTSFHGLQGALANLAKFWRGWNESPPSLGLVAAS